MRKILGVIKQWSALVEFIRYAVVGLLNNLMIYMVYLLVTFLGLDPKIAITIFYPLGALSAYFGHLKYSFLYTGEKSWMLFKFVFAYALCYGLNLFMLFVLTDIAGFSHQLVQALAIAIIGVVLFLMIKYFVLSPIAKNEPREAT